jgi:low affinity Fe/Cu permease
MKLTDSFNRFAKSIARTTGHAASFGIAVAVILVWAATGPLFHFSDTWQLVINTSTTIVTFLMVFLIQNTQNRDATAMHLKLDELIRAVKGAQNSLVNLEDMTEEELEHLHRRYVQLAEEARGHVQARTRGHHHPKGGGEVKGGANAP